MNLSSRWCVTAVVALGAVACSDPVPPPAQGAFIANVQSVSPPVANKMCPSGAALTYEVPTTPIPTTEHPKIEALSGSTYLHKIIDGEDSSTVHCAVKSGSAGISFEGRISLGGKAIEVSGGTLPDKKSGTARITFSKSSSPGFSNSLSSAPGGCTVEAVVTDKGIQAKAGSMWAHFSCAGIDHEPSDHCKSEGFFVLENCDQ
jgi:hypothetical protein